MNDRPLFLQRLLDGTYPGNDFDKTLTAPIFGFEALVVLAFLATLFFLPRFQKKIPLKFAAAAAGILIFEMFTSPMWKNLHLGSWAYLYQDVSWVLTLGWASLILWVVTLVDRRLSKVSALGRFGLYLLFMAPVVLLLQVMVVQLGIREYSAEVRQAVSGNTFFGAPIEALYYTPVFMSLVLGFYKFWELIIDGELIVPLRKLPLWRRLALTFLGVFLFEIMIEPMVENVGFPEWSYVYHDVSLVMTGLWVLIIWMAVNIVDRFVMHWDLAHRYLLYLAATGIVAMPVEGWLIEKGYRVYGSGAQANFSGAHVPGTNVPIEVAFAIPMYFALVIALVQYLDWAITQRRIKA